MARRKDPTVAILGLFFLFVWMIAQAVFTIIKAIFQGIQNSQQKRNQQLNSQNREIELTLNRVIQQANLSNIKSQLPELPHHEARRLSRNLEDILKKSKINNIQSYFDTEDTDDYFSGLHNLKYNEVPFDKVATLLSQDFSPYGLELLNIPQPKLLEIPNLPTDAKLTNDLNSLAQKAQDSIAAYNGATNQVFKQDTIKANEILKLYNAGDTDGIIAVSNLALACHKPYSKLSGPFELQYDPTSRVLLCEVKVPDFSAITFVHKKSSSYSAKWLPLAKTHQQKAKRQCLHALCIRAAYILAKSDIGNYVDVVSVNAKQDWHDPSTGVAKQGIIATFQALKVELQTLQPHKIEPTTCFEHFKGLTVPSLEIHSTLRPIFVLNKDDQRIVANKDVVADIPTEANLASMPWEDFEHLVRQLFELEFGQNGVEVKVTRASRDRGVDAIMFDPDPLRGGKFVLQAKRYTRPVDVAAVRDLYGTVMNEGANRGILVTTSSYGPDSYEFAKGKPLSLVDGPNLLAMLEKHGKNFRINLAEARLAVVNS